MEEEPSCGHGLAQSTAMPAGLAAVSASLARNLEVHTHALDPANAAAAREREVYERIAQSLLSAAEDLRSAAAEMALAVELPIAAHDVAALTTPEVVDAFERGVAAENDLRRLLEARLTDNEQMLQAIRTDIEKL